MKDQKFRAFIAIDFADDMLYDLTGLIQYLQQHRQFHSIKWTKTENLHITMRFLGNITPAQYETVATHLTAISAIEPFVVNFPALILFPNPDRPVAIALKPEPLALLLQVHQQIDQAVVKCGLELEQKIFLPHLTLGKIKPRRHIELPQLTLPKLQLPVKHVTLFRSDINMQGSQYTPLVCIPF